MKSKLENESKYILSEPSTSELKLYTVYNQKDSLLLRSLSEDIVPDSNDHVLTHLISRMYATVKDTNNPGVGIAAPQVGILKRIILVQRFDKENYPFEVYFNARIKQYSKLKQGGKEGCLSVPETDGNVCRSYAVLVEYNMIDGKHYTEMVEGYTAIIFQHEIDHLDGKLFIDYISENTNAMTEEEFAEFCHEQSKQ